MKSLPTRNDVRGPNRARTSSVDFASDQDWLRVAVSSGQTYLFEASGASTREGTLEDPFLRLVDAGGNEIASGSDAGVGLDDRIIYTADGDQTLYLAVSGQSEDDQGSYRVVASEYAGELLGDLPRCMKVSNCHRRPYRRAAITRRPLAARFSSLGSGATQLQQRLGLCSRRRWRDPQPRVCVRFVHGTVAR